MDLETGKLETPTYDSVPPTHKRKQKRPRTTDYNLHPTYVCISHGQPIDIDKHESTPCSPSNDTNKSRDGLDLETGSKEMNYIYLVEHMINRIMMSGGYLMIRRRARGRRGRGCGELLQHLDRTAVWVVWVVVHYRYHGNQRHRHAHLVH